MDAVVTDRQSALDFLYSRINYERLAHVPYQTGAFKLDRMRQLLARLGDPHLALKAVHIAGTKGKGSTAAMIAAVLQTAGYKTALYTSPHLERLEERFVVDGACIPEDELVALAAELAPVVAEMDRDIERDESPGSGLTFFEVTTALAFLHFARQKVDIAVLEVGLGGRLDSTNVCQPEVCAITSISYDHTKQLGSTLAEIAREKAGIIKPGVTIVSGVLEDEPRQVIEQVARENAAPLRQRGRDFDCKLPAAADFRPPSRTQPFDYWEQEKPAVFQIRGLTLSLLGRHQIANAAVAVATMRELVRRGWNIEESAIRQGFSAARACARIEVARQQPPVVLDVAHNVASVAALIEVLREQFPLGNRTLIFASSRDKDVAGMLRLLLPEFETVILTKYVSNPRGMEGTELDLLARRNLEDWPPDSDRQPPDILVEPSPRSAWQRAQACAGKSGLVCITGSFFLAADLGRLVRS